MDSIDQIITRIIDDLNQLTKLEKIPENWHWHREIIDKELILIKKTNEDLEKLQIITNIFEKGETFFSEKQKLNKDFLSIVQTIILLQKDLNIMKNGKEVCEQEKIANEVNNIIYQLNRCIYFLLDAYDNKSLRLMLARLIKKQQKPEARKNLREHLFSLIEKWGLNFKIQKFEPFDEKKYKANLIKAFSKLQKFKMIEDDSIELIKDNFRVVYIQLETDKQNKFIIGLPRIQVNINPDNKPSAQQINKFLENFRSSLKNYKPLLAETPNQIPDLDEFIKNCEQHILFFIEKCNQNFITKEKANHYLKQLLLKTVDCVKKSHDKIEIEKQMQLLKNFELKPKEGDLFHDCNPNKIDSILDTGILATEPLTGNLDNMRLNINDVETSFFVDFNVVTAPNLIFAETEFKGNSYSCAERNNDNISLVVRPSISSTAKEVLTPFNFRLKEFGDLIVKFPSFVQNHGAVACAVASTDIIAIIAGGKTDIDYLKSALINKKRFIPVYNLDHNILFNYEDYEKGLKKLELNKAA